VNGIDWPLAVTLAFVFVVMSFLRWRYFRSRARRLDRERARQEPPVT
jgi:hypothetical protein